MESILWWGFYFWTFYAFLPGFISRMFGFRVFSKGKTDKEVALTFDDGPDPVYTPILLDLLKEYGAKATFFVVGSNAERHPELIYRMHEEGHIIGIHNYVHRSNWIMRPRTVKRQVQRTSDIIWNITGERPEYYRPPWGIVNVFDFARKGHLQIVLWTSMFGDWNMRLGADRLYQKMKRRLQPGQVMLLHDCGATLGADRDAPANTIAALRLILEDGRRMGLRFVDIREMMELTSRNKARRKSKRSGDSNTPIQTHAELKARPEKNESSTARGGEIVHHPSLFKRILVAGWMKWEHVFKFLFRLKPVGDGHSFHYRIIPYGGQTLTLADGARLKKGDYVMEIHFVNKRMYEMGMTSRSDVHTAIRVIQTVKHALPDMALELSKIPLGAEVKALYGVSMINRGSEGLGFQTFELPGGVFKIMTNWYLRILTTVIHPDGRTRVKEHGSRMDPRILIMPRERLLDWRHKPAAPRRERPAEVVGEVSSFENGAAFNEESSVSDRM